MLKIVAYPKDSNPYQRLLYGDMPHDDVKVAYVDIQTKNALQELVYIPLAWWHLLLFRLQGHRVLHIHWLYQLNVSSRTPFHYQLAFLKTLLFFASAKVLRYKCVWTVHNLLPHTQQTSNDKLVAKMLSKLADEKIVHSAAVVPQMRELGLDTTHTHIIPIGSYEDVYTSTISAKEARAKLGLRDKDETVILFFGLVRSYKGLDDLIAALANLNLPRVRLVIAGRCEEASLAMYITESAKYIGLDFYNQFIPDEDVATYFRACDIVCLPFKKVTTSSSVLLAASFGRATIVPRIGALADMPADAAMLYDPKEPKALEKMLRQAITDKQLTYTVGTAAYEYNKTLSWDKIAQKTYKLYQDVLSADAKDKI